MSKKNNFSIFVLALMLTAAPFSFGVPSELPELPPGPLLLDDVEPSMLQADYWINRLPNPDLLMKTPEELQKFNEEITQMIPERVDVFTAPAREPGQWIRNQIRLEFSAVRNRMLFGTNDKEIPKSIFDNTIKPRLDVDGIPKSVKLKWGTATRSTSVRALPSYVTMLEEVADYEFDQLQFSLIKLWTPVGIYHTSKDGEWYYIQAPYVRGWVQAKDIALFNTRDELKKFTKPVGFIVVTGESIPIFRDAGLTDHYTYPSTGTVLPLAGKTGSAFEIWMPSRGKNGKVKFRREYVDLRSDVSVGYLPLTQRNVLNQAFKLLGQRYGWGGLYNGRDCSGFIHDVYLSMGVDMPRDSDQQAFVGTQLGHFIPGAQREERKQALRASAPGFTLLKMPLHLMMYIGEVDGKFYIIHSTWAERVSMTSDEKVRINQVVVSTLQMNGKSYLGPLFDRTISMNEIY